MNIGSVFLTDRCPNVKSLKLCGNLALLWNTVTTVELSIAT